jgi:hypothetical protein
MNYNIPFSPTKENKIQRIIIKNKQIKINGKRKIKNNNKKIKKNDKKNDKKN